MKHLLIFLCFVLTLTVYGSERLSVTDLPMPLWPLAEVETNVVFSTGAATDNKWTLTIERDVAASNCVEVVFGADADGDGKLGVKEGELCVGWDCEPGPRGEVVGVIGVPVGRVAHMLQPRLEPCPRCLSWR